MSMDALLPSINRFTPRNARRSFRLLHPGAQLRLALYVLAVGLGFGILFVLNSYAAYGRLFDAAMALSEPVLAKEIQAQTSSYLGVSLALVAGYAACVLAITVVYLRRLLGPLVAMERHVKALEFGNYSSRLVLREDNPLHRGLVRRLNGLATRLDSQSGQGS